MITLKPPFRAKDMKELFQAVQSGTLIKEYMKIFRQIIQRIWPD